jgi:DNA end-binding protein Ku
MRAIWTGAVVFGQISIPVKLYTATEDNEVSLNLVHRTDGGRIRHLRVCEKDGQEVPYDEIARAYEYTEGEYIVLDESDFERAGDGKRSSVDIAGFIVEDQVDVRYLERPFYLEPGKGADRAYALLREAMRRSGKLAIGRFSLKGREHLAVIKPVGRVLVLNQMRFPTSLRSPGGLKLPTAGPDEQEVELAIRLIDRLTRPFNPEHYPDTYTEDLQSLISAKVRDQLPAPKAEPKSVAPPQNLEAALEASLRELG